MSGKAYLTKKKRDTPGLLQIPEPCRLIVPSLSTKADPKKKTENKDYKQAFTFNPNPAAYLIALKERAADIIPYTKRQYNESMKALQRDQIRTENGKRFTYPDIMLLLALFSILQHNKDLCEGTQAEAVIDIRDLLVYIGVGRTHTAPKKENENSPGHYTDLDKKIYPLLYIGGIIGGDVYPVLSEYHIDTENRLLTFKSPYCIALMERIAQDQSKAGNRAAYCQDIKASICTARNKGAAAAVCYAACICLQTGKPQEKELSPKGKKDNDKPKIYKSVQPGTKAAHIKPITLINAQAAIKERYEGSKSRTDQNEYLSLLFSACSRYFDKYTTLAGYSFPEKHITTTTLEAKENTIIFDKDKQEKITGNTLQNYG